MRGVTSELVARGHGVRVFEPADGWSRDAPACSPRARPRSTTSTARSPRLRSDAYDPRTFDPARALAGADLVIVHEWNDHELVARLGELRARGARFRLLFHDTHHRSVTDPRSMARVRPAPLRRRARLRSCDPRHLPRARLGGASLDVARGGGHARVPAPAERGSARRHHLDRELGRRRAHGRAAALPARPGGPARTDGLDLRRPLPARGSRRDRPSRVSPTAAGSRTIACRPPSRAHRVTVHVPRRPYVAALPGIPTIRPFEALACGIPLVCAPWTDEEGLFTAGSDFLVARDGDEMAACLHGNPHGHLARRIARASRSRDHPRAPHLRPPRRRAAADRRRARRGDEPCRPSRHRWSRLMRIAFFGSSLVSSYWNGAATYYRGIVRALHRHGHQVTFFEPDAYERQAHRDIPDPAWATVVVYAPERFEAALEGARGFDVVVKTSGVGVNDSELESGVLALGAPTTIFWDVDAPATLQRMEEDPHGSAAPARALVRPDPDLRRRRACLPALPGARRAGVHPGLQRGRPRRRTSPYLPTRATAAISGSSRTGSPIARRVCARSSCRPRSGRRSDRSCSAAAAGTTRRSAPTSAMSVTSRPPTTTPSTAARSRS